MADGTYHTRATVNISSNDFILTGIGNGTVWEGAG